jgi:arylsulfatase A-like enzyme
MIDKIPLMNSRRIMTGLLCGLALLCAAHALAAESARPNVLIVTIDTLRADRMSGYGYERPTSPFLDGLMERGVRFTEARTVEPLTGPALCSMITARYPHETGASRNGLRMRPGLSSLPKRLQEEGYVTAAIVSNWTLKNKISNLAEHFDEYNELLRKKRWLGLFSGETKAEDVTEVALEWMEHYSANEERPFFFWAHYIDPHAPYVNHKEFLEPLGIEKRRGKPPISDRYDTEIAHTDRVVSGLFERMEELGLTENTVIVFTSDHGESLGEHGYVGHGRHLYEPSLRIPLSITWEGKVEPGLIEAPALNIDVAPTILGLLGLDPPQGFRGFDWTPVMAGEVAQPMDRTTQHQAHRGAVLTRHDSETKRRAGLLEVALVQNGVKEIMRVRTDEQRWRFDLQADPEELVNLADPESNPTAGLSAWMQVVDFGLRSMDDVPPAPLDDETIEQLRALGYAD